MADAAKEDVDAGAAAAPAAAAAAVKAEDGQPDRSKEGWIIFVTGVHNEAQEEDVRDMFADYGEVTNINVNLDRKSGFVKGYAIIEYAEKEEAQAAIDGANGTDLLGQTVAVGWAFVKGKYASKSVANRGRAPPPRRD